ncbi:RidA family protein [Halobacteriales archaeon Cl-PHB]
MKKTQIAPGQGPIDSDELDEPQISLAVATQHETCVHVDVNGLVYPDGDVREQARECLGLVRKMVGEFDGTLEDLVKLRWYVDADVLDSRVRGKIQEVQAEFVDRPHYPSSCIVATPKVLGDGALLELEARAIVPDDEWTVETITGDA